MMKCTYHKISCLKLPSKREIRGKYLKIEVNKWQEKKQLEPPAVHNISDAAVQLS